MDIQSQVKEKLKATLIEIELEMTSIFEAKADKLEVSLFESINHSNLNESEKNDLKEKIKEILYIAYPTAQVALDNLNMIKD
jgi:hypothetical protein